MLGFRLMVHPSENRSCFHQPTRTYSSTTCAPLAREASLSCSAVQHIDRRSSFCIIFYCTTCAPLAREASLSCSALYSIYRSPFKLRAYLLFYTYLVPNDSFLSYACIPLRCLGFVHPDPFRSAEYRSSSPKSTNTPSRWMKAAPSATAAASVSEKKTSKKHPKKRPALSPTEPKY